MLLSDALALLDGKKELTAADVVTLRHIIYGEDQAVSQCEAEALFKLNADAGSLSLEWSQLFVEAMTDYIVHEEMPSGYINQANADWLIAQIKTYGRVHENEVEMLIHVLEEADESPVALSNFVLELVKGPILKKLQNGQRLEKDDVERVRRVIYAKGGDGNIAVTRHEAEALFDINDAINTADADPAWLEVFKRAVASAVLFASPWHPDRDETLKNQNWLADPHIHWGRINRVDMLEAVREITHLDIDDHIIDHACAAEKETQADAEKLTNEKTHWLIERFRRTGRYDKNERAVADYIRDNARSSDEESASSVAALDEIASVTPTKV
jgi:hypothetical protein